MIKNKRNNIKTIGLALVATSMLSACGAGDRISNIGKPPEMSSISNPVLAEGYQPITMPMPAPTHAETQMNSLWASDRQTFFKDQRASNVGDIITVLVDIQDEATLENETERTRSSEETAALNRLLGIEEALSKVLPTAVDNTALIDGGADSTFAGAGSVEREEEITVRLAALVTQILPNGNMAIHGRQEVLVNFEKRILQVNGVIRPQDISVGNTITYDQIAEARIVYGGEGQITDVQQPRYGQQLYDIVFPF